MKFAALALLGVASAMNESQETLVAQKAELMQELAQIDEQINLEDAAAATPAAAPAAAAAATDASAALAKAVTDAQAAQSSNTMLYVGVGVTLAVVGGIAFYVWKKKQSAGADNEGGSDDLFTKLVNEA